MTNVSDQTSTPKLRLIFVRHGRADGVDGRCVGHFDAPLSQRGVAEIRAMSFPESLVTAIICSDLRRASHSARILAEKYDLPLTMDARLREMNFGDWEGHEWNELQRSDGARLSAWMEHWTEAAPPNGETVGDLVARVKHWLHDIRSAANNYDHAVIVVAHAGSIRAALCVLNEIPIEKMFDIVVEHATPLTVGLDALPRAGLRESPDQSV